MNCFLKLLVVSYILSTSVFCNDNIEFELSILHDNQIDTPQNIFDKRKVILNRNDKIKISLNAKTELTAYFFYISSSKELSVLSSNTLKPSESTFFLPGAEQWYQFDNNNGVDRFIFIASKERIDSIDDLIKKFEKFPKKYYTQLMNEIKRQKMINSSMASDKVHAIEIGGVVRGSSKKTEPAVLIETNNFFTRTYRFEHK